MAIPVQVTFHNLGHSDAIDSRIRAKAAQLEKFYSRITSVRVVIGPSGRRHRHGNLYCVRIYLTVPGHEIVVSRDPPKDKSHEDAYVAIRDAFDSARRQLEDAVRIYFYPKSRRYLRKMSEPWASKSLKENSSVTQS